MASFIGFVAFLWPFVVAPGKFGDTSMAPLMFGALLVLVLAVVFAEIADGGIDAKAIAMLGCPVGDRCRVAPTGSRHRRGRDGVLHSGHRRAGYSAPGSASSLGCTTLFASALITGGVGPWMPYQMFGCAWVGLFAGLLPPASGRREVFMLALYGAALRLSLRVHAEPVVLAVLSRSAEHASPTCPGASLAVNVHRYLVFDATTSLGWDTGRAVTNFVLILLVGSAMLATFRRAARRAAFEAPVRFEDHTG